MKWTCTLLLQAVVGCGAAVSTMLPGGYSGNLFCTETGSQFPYTATRCWEMGCSNDK